MASASGSIGAGSREKIVEKSYLASAVDSIYPWNTGRSSTPPPKDKDKETMPPPPKPPAKKADDHSVNTLYGQSFRKYPLDCPPLDIRWFHAVDVPKRKPQFIKGKTEKEDSKPAAPKKFVAFTNTDSWAIESAYQKALEARELEEERGYGSSNRQIRSNSHRRGRAVSDNTANTSIDGENGSKKHGMRVPVNEDFLFDVDIEERELAPVYWLGPVYEVRRGTWFYQEGSTLRPCEENLAAQLEEGYLKTKPWTYPPPRNRSNSGTPHNVTPKASRDSLRAAAASQKDEPLRPVPSQTNLQLQHQPQTYRLFGTYMNSIATYQDSTTAWLTSDSMLSWVTSTVYQRFTGGGYMSGVKLVRGYSEPGKKDDKRPTTPITATLSSSQQLSESEQKALKRRSAPPLARADSASSIQNDDAETAAEMERHENRLKRQFSSYMENAENPDKQAEQIRKREESEIQEDYNAQAGETQGREIEHLILVTHGIGQRLGYRMDSVNFVHDVNMLRKTLKGVYSHSADLRALNSEDGDGPGNCRVQVLPVCWRHLLDFPKRREKKGEHDLGTAAFDEEDEYPSLEDITIEGVAFARSLISDLALDVLLYQSAYREQITGIVLKECNRIYKLFLQRNPDFHGKVHIMGHSLGSAIMFDILCRQREKTKKAEQQLRHSLRIWPGADVSEPPRVDPRNLVFDFDVYDFYCLGSPIGLFQMLKGRTVSARHMSDSKPSESPIDNDYMDPADRISPITGLPFSISSPKVEQLFNIFHPSDPIAYRIEPLVSPAMSSLKPQILPYTKKGIFNSVAPQGLSGIGVKVGQSVSGLWSSISGGIASSILNRSLGLSNEDVANFQANSVAASPAATPQQPSTPAAASSPAAGTNIISGGVIPLSDTVSQSEKMAKRQRALARQNTTGSMSSKGASGQTLIDDELETLYARFQKKRIEEHKDSSGQSKDGRALESAWAAEELKAQKLRREELKVRALNRNGRVDYSIQESVLDFNPINTIASHMAYWQDEDVSHFVMSQLLSNRSRRGMK